jgi:hypothetical protein
MYTTQNFRTKRELKEAVKAGERVTVFWPGFQPPMYPYNGRVSIEGPHYPEPHRWYATAIVRDNVVIRVS